MLSRKTKYGIKAILVLAKEYDTSHIVPISTIADREKIPLKFLESILLQLKNAGMLESKRGPGGGYYLARKPMAISLADVIRELNGPIAPIRCVSSIAYKPCDECLDPDICSLRMVMNEVRLAMVIVLKNISLDDMIRLSDKAAQELEAVTNISLSKI